MTLLLLEALGAMVILCLIVWWTMFSGRKKGELKDQKPVDDGPEKNSRQSDLIQNEPES